MTHIVRFFKSVSTNLITTLSVVSATAVVGYSSISHAHNGHTPNYCSVTASTVCAHLGFDTKPNSSDAWEFMLHFMPATGIDPKLITNVSVKLWMDMGSHSHGSSPVTLTGVDDVHYHVTEAYFPMAGAWQVKVGFTFENATHEIIVPVMVSQ
jgi:hypothetical protein